jgi:hypothetical protein
MEIEVESNVPSSKTLVVQPVASCVIPKSIIDFDLRDVGLFGIINEFQR